MNGKSVVIFARNAPLMTFSKRLSRNYQILDCIHFYYMYIHSLLFCHVFASANGNLSAYPYRGYSAHKR